MRTTVVNIYRDEYDVYIGRPGKGQDGYFGNTSDLNCGREESVRQFREYFSARIASDQEFKQRVEGLRGKRLACFCCPKLCHGMVIVEYLENISTDRQIAEYNENHKKIEKHKKPITDMFE